MHVGKLVGRKNDGISQVVARQIYVAGELSRREEKLQVGIVASGKSYRSKLAGSAQNSQVYKPRKCVKLASGKLASEKHAS